MASTSSASDLSAKLGQLNIPKLIERLEEVDQEDDDQNASQVLESGKDNNFRTEQKMHYNIKFSLEMPPDMQRLFLPPEGKVLN